MTTPPARHAVSLRGPYGVVALGAAVSVGIATAAGADRFGVPTAVAFAAGAVVGVLAVGALPSIPTRIATALALAAGGFVLTRYARVGAVPAVTVLLWAFTTAATLAALERAAAHRYPGGERRPGSGAKVLAGIVACGAVVAVGALAFWPLLAVAGTNADRGAPADPFSEAGQGTLGDASRLDTRSRPALSDAVVMRVRASRPAFWRGATYDMWNGRVWTRADERSASPLRAASGNPSNWANVPAGAGARVGTARTNEQTFEIVAGFAETIFAAPEAVALDADHLVAVRTDGTLTAAADPLGRGARYTVRSEEPLATVATLRAARGEIPEALLARYAHAPVASARVRTLAHEITDGAATTYDKVRAIERWLGANVEYSLEAPLPPETATDTVDWFVFEGRAGWCEQIGSTLVVMLREVGVPARLATGFVTGEHDDLTGRYTVRERDAHAWAEVWFPGVGWQGFDPTAAVPLAGESEEPASILAWLRRRGPAAVLVGGVGAAIVWGLRSVVARHRAHRARPVPAWSDVALADLERVGAGFDRPRHPAETPVAYAGVLAALAGEASLSTLGRVIDADAYGSIPVDRTARDAARGLLDRLLA